jgi:hypothetical protein
VSRSVGPSGARTFQTTLGALGVVLFGAAGAVSLLPQAFQKEPGGLGSFLVSLQPALLLLAGLSLGAFLVLLRVDTTWASTLKGGLALAIVGGSAGPAVRLLMAESQERAAHLSRLEWDRQNKLTLERTLAAQAAVVAEGKRLAALPPPRSSLQPCVSEGGDCPKGERCFKGDGLCHKRCSFSSCSDSESCHAMRFGGDDTPQFDGICFASWPPETPTSPRRPVIQLPAPVE